MRHKLQHIDYTLCRWPFIIDPSNQAATYLRYQDTNYLNALAPKDMAPEVIRRALIGSIRFGKPMVLDMMEVDMFQTASDRMDEVLPGLMTLLMDKSIMKEDKYVTCICVLDMQILYNLKICTSFCQITIHHHIQLGM